jgi:hypothetical protein
MTAAVWAIGIGALLAVGLTYLIGDAWGQARGHARGYAAGQRDGRRAMYQLHRDGLRKQARDAEQIIECLYRQARLEIKRFESHPSTPDGSARP